MSPLKTCYLFPLTEKYVTIILIQIGKVFYGKFQNKFSGIKLKLKYLINFSIKIIRGL